MGPASSRASSSGHERRSLRAVARRLAGHPYDGSMSRREHSRAAVGALLLDVVVVTGFAVIGRVSHAEGLDAAGVWGTA